MKNFEDYVRLYAELDQREKSIKKEKDPLNKEIKKYMIENDLSDYSGEDFKITLGKQERTKMNEDKLLFKLKQLGLTEAIKTVEIPDEAAVEALIYEGRLNPLELEACIERKIIETLTVKVGKK